MSFDDLYSNYAILVRQIIRSTTRQFPADVVDDIAQDVWISIYKIQSSPKHHIRDWQAYIRTVAYHHAIAARKRLATTPTKSLDQMTEECGDHFEIADVPSSSLPAELDDIIADAVMSLPPRTRQATILRYWDGLSSPEIALKMGITDGTVRALLFDAKQALQQSVSIE